MDSFTTIVASVCEVPIESRGPMSAETAPIINENATRSGRQPIRNVYRPITKRDFTFVAKENDDNLVKSTLTISPRCQYIACRVLYAAGKPAKIRAD